MEWARALGMGEWGASRRPGNARGARAGRDSLAASEEHPYIPAPLLYQGVYYMVKTGGIITSLDPRRTHSEAGPEPGALASTMRHPLPRTVRCSANTEGKITVLKAGAEWECSQSTKSTTRSCDARPERTDGSTCGRAARCTDFASGGRPAAALRYDYALFPKGSVSGYRVSHSLTGRSSLWRAVEK